MADLAAQIKSFTLELNPKAEFPEKWDKDLPLHCYLPIDAGSQLVVAKAGANYVVSVIRNGKVTSVLVSNIEDVPAALLIAGDNHNAPQGSSHPQSSSSHPTLFNHRGPLEMPYDTVNDPNAPPGFEDEYQLSQRQHNGPSIQFNPDSDRLPPGGAHPELNSVFGGIHRDGEGMNPSLVGGPQAGHIRYDPTSPFDPSRSGFLSSGGPGRMGSGAGLGGSGFGGGFI